jgi:uncharacterized membrane protein YecN with MAPEG domain
MQTVAVPLISALTAAILVLGQMALMFTVIGERWRARQSLGEAGDETLLRAVRRHGNYAENAAVFIASLALLEMIGAPRALVITLAALIVIGRVLHAVGLSREQTVNLWRASGVVATLGAGVAIGAGLVVTGVARLG